MFPDLRNRRALIRMRISMMFVVVAGLMAPGALLTHAQEPVVKSAAPVRLLNPIDEHVLTTLQGNVRRDLTPDRDLGPVDDSMQAHYYLLLKRTPEQQADLDYLIARQQERTATEYHKWLTPKQFGARFGAHPDDIARLSSWLELHGFKVTSVMNNASTIDFAGSAGQIREAFHTQLHYFNISGGKYAANIQDPQIPSALAPVVAGIAGLSRIPEQAAHTQPRQVAYDETAHHWKVVNRPVEDRAMPAYDEGAPEYVVTPQDLYAIYNMNPILNGGDLAATATVAVIERTDIEYGTVNSTTGVATGGDVVTFRNLFGVPGTLNLHVYHGYGTVTCSDPGIVTPDDSEASLDAEWINATAPSANQIFMSCDSTTDLGNLSSFEALVDNNLADVLSWSYTASELSLAGSDATYQFLDTIEAQAATQGQTIFICSGDSGSDDKDQDTTGTATNGINVSGFSSPLVTVAGGTDFQDYFDAAEGGAPQSTYWSSTNNNYGEDALGYIPETVWDASCASSINQVYNGYALGADLCAERGTVSNGRVVGGGGGISTHYTVPSWQTGISGYSNAYRASPDLVGFASSGFWDHSLLFCDSNEASTNCTTLSTLGSAGGTSFVTPYLAGVAGLLVSYTGSRQGLLNPTLYALAKAQFTNPATSTACYANGQTSNSGVTTGLPAASCIFNDVTTSGNDVPCAAGTTDCYVNSGASYGMLSLTTGSLTIPYPATPGFDEATGIGSVNVANLITKWETAFTSSTTLTATPTSITPSSSTTLKAVVTGEGSAGYVDSPPVATGTVNFKVGTTSLGSCTLSGGSCTLVVEGTSLAMGANSITATFTASPQYPSSTSSVVTVTVGSASQNPTTLSSPAQGATFAGPSETFTWALASGANGYFLHLGTTGVGSDNLLNSAEYSSTATSVTVTGLPVNGETIYARLFTDFSGTHLYKDYTFTASKEAGLNLPGTSGTLAGPNVTFGWTAATGSSVKGYFLHLGSTGVGSDNLLNSAEYSTSTTSVALTGLPVNGETIYARVFTDYNGTHLYQDYTFTASKQAALTEPGTSGTLAGPNVTFGWSAATGSSVKGYFLHLGTTGVGSENLLNSAEYSTSTTSVALTGLPLNGETIYARVFTDYNGTHLYQDYVFTAAKEAALTTPAPGSTLSGTTVTFGWSAATGGNVKGYFLHLGTTGVGSENVLNSAEYPTTQTSVSVSGLPTSGTIYARVFTDYNGVHEYQDYTYTAQ